MHRSIATFLLLLLGSLTVACAGDPDLAASAGSLEEDVGPAIERVRWVAARPGCEGAGGSLVLHAAATEPLLGVLVDTDGAIVCVDAMALLQEERGPTPTALSFPDPTPTPILRGPHEDPTPTPIVEPDLP